ncbi:hypothetical protein ACET3Z_013488 [Daucus carota]
MLVDGEACTLPQLELLEATREIEPVLEWGESGAADLQWLMGSVKAKLCSVFEKQNCCALLGGYVKSHGTKIKLILLKRK